MIQVIFYLLAVIAFGLVMLEKEVIGLSGVPLLGAGLFCLALAGMVPTVLPVMTSWTKE